MKKRVRYSIGEIFEDFITSEMVPEAQTIQYDFDGVYYTVVGFEDLQMFLMDHFEWEFFAPRAIYGPYRKEWAFWEVWKRWKAAHKQEIDRIAEAWFSKYNPIGNYDRKENSTTVREYDNLEVDKTWGTITNSFGQETRTYGDREDSTEYGAFSKLEKPASYTEAIQSGSQNGQKHTVTVTDNNTITSSIGTGAEVAEETQVATYNSDKKDVDTVKHKGDTVSTSYKRMMYDSIDGDFTTSEDEHTDKTTHGGGIDTIDRGPDTVERDNDKETTSGKYTDTTESSISGNIGVTTSQQMIEAEWELRRKALASRVLKWFADECLFVSPGGELDAY